MKQLPDNWHWSLLGDLANVWYGKARPKDDEGPYPVIGSGGVYSYSTRPLINYETIVIGRKGSAGTAYYCADPCYPADTTFFLEWKQPVHVPFVYAWLQFRNLAPDHSVIPSLQRGDVESFPIPLPPLEEQKAITAVLRTVQEAIAARRREAALERERKAALMQRLFTYGTRGERLKDTAVGRVPESWEVKPLKACAFVQTGVTKGRRFGVARTITVPYLRVANVQDGYLDLSEIKEIKIRDNELERYLLREGDVVVTEGGDLDKLGRGFIWHGQVANCVHQNHIFAIRANLDLLLPEYLAYFVQGQHSKAYFLSVGHKTTNLATGALC